MGHPPRASSMPPCLWQLPWLGGPGGVAGRRPLAHKQAGVPPTSRRLAQQLRLPFAPDFMPWGTTQQACRWRPPSGAARPAAWMVDCMPALGSTARTNTII